MNIRISADSTCDLPQELVAQKHITITPLYIRMGEQTWRDGVDIDVDALYEKTEAGGDLPATAAVNVQDYLDVFTALRRECDAVIHFTISGEMSSCYQNACIAASEVDGVYVVDSRNLSTGIGHLVLDACEMAEQGQDAADIARELTERREKLDVSFVLSTLEYIRRGGRCSAVAAFGANLLHLRPLIAVRNGVMGVGKKYRGDIKKVLVEYVRDKLADPASVDERRIFITDSGVSEEIRDAVEQAVRECVPFREVIHTRAGCTISGHCGPACLGILFYRK